MPYIVQKARKEYNHSISNVVKKLTNLEDENDVGGHLNYLISAINNGYLKKKGLKYHRIQMLIGALECCQMELYRCVAACYEDKKEAENGPVYED